MNTKVTQCMICGSPEGLRNRTHSSGVNTCHVCQKVVCKSCWKMSVCIDCYQALPQDKKEGVDKLHKKYTIMRKFGGILMLGWMGLVVFNFINGLFPNSSLEIKQWIFLVGGGITFAVVILVFYSLIQLSGVFKEDRLRYLDENSQ